MVQTHPVQVSYLHSMGNSDRSLPKKSLCFEHGSSKIDSPVEKPGIEGTMLENPRHAVQQRRHQKQCEALNVQVQSYVRDGSRQVLQNKLSSTYSAGLTRARGLPPFFFQRKSEGKTKHDFCFIQSLFTQNFFLFFYYLLIFNFFLRGKGSCKVCLLKVG